VQVLAAATSGQVLTVQENQRRLGELRAGKLLGGGSKAQALRHGHRPSARPDCLQARLHGIGRGGGVNDWPEVFRSWDGDFGEELLDENTLAAGEQARPRLARCQDDAADSGRRLGDCLRWRSFRKNNRTASRTGRDKFRPSLVE
jgi:hypothetical protein